VLGARMTGAGFGGCTVNLVQSDAAETFGRRMAEGYTAVTGLVPDIYVCLAEEGVRTLE
jgi:galactokinase